MTTQTNPADETAENIRENQADEPSAMPKRRGRPRGQRGHKRGIGDVEDRAGIIRDDETLSLDAFCTRMGMTRLFVIHRFPEVIRGSARHPVIPGRLWNEFVATQEPVDPRRGSYKAKRAAREAAAQEAQKRDGSTGAANAPQEAAAPDTTEGRGTESPARDGHFDGSGPGSQA